MSSNSFRVNLMLISQFLGLSLGGLPVFGLTVSPLSFCPYNKYHIIVLAKSQPLIKKTFPNYRKGLYISINSVKHSKYLACLIDE